MNAPQKILLVQLYSNGDCLYATTVAQQIKRDYPGCILTWAIATFCKSIIENNPYVDAIMEVTILKNDVVAFRKFKKKIKLLKSKGEFDEIFITHNMDTNLAYYDGCIRSGILRAYPRPITTSVKPVLNLYKEEIQKASEFASTHMLQNYTHVILFEFAPQSKQLNIPQNFAIAIAKDLAKNIKLAIILSSANPIKHTYKNIIDGSALTLRETAALTHYCTLLLGCSSGITWISTSGAAKQLPMVQLINPAAAWLNPVSRDFKRFGLEPSTIIELTQINKIEIVNCINLAIENFSAAWQKYNRQIPEHFRTTKSIVYNLICYFEFAAITTHIKVNREVYGDNINFYRQLLYGFLTAPFKLIKNILVKNFRGVSAFF